MSKRLPGRVAFLVAAATLVTLAVSAASWAQDTGPGEKRAKDQIDECLGDGYYPYGPPTCTFDSEGNLIERHVPGDSGSSSSVAGLLFFGILWAAIPMGIAGGVASSRGQSVGLALLLTLILGWIGLLIAVFLQKPEIVEATRATMASARRGDVADRVRKLGELRDEGLLTEEEFRAKKAEILGTA